jgi:hypothetical protein
MHGMNEMKVLKKAGGFQLLCKVRGLSPGIINTHSSLRNSNRTTATFSSNLKFNDRIQQNCLFNPNWQQANMDFELRHIRQEILTFCTASRPALGPTQPHFNGYRVFFRAKCWRCVDHSPPSYDEVKNEWCYTSKPYKCLHGVDR